MWIHLLSCCCCCAIMFKISSVVEAEPWNISQTFPGLCQQTLSSAINRKVSEKYGFHIRISGNPNKYLPEEMYTDGYKIPSGTFIGFFPYVLHQNPELYPEPEIFNPDKFVEFGPKPWTFVPFAESVRFCLGKNYAMLEMKVLLTHVIRNFKILSLTLRQDVEVSWGTMLNSSIPLSVKFIPR